MDKYTKQELDSVISVKLTLRDLIILSWGHESVSFVPSSEEETEFRDAEAKIDAALATLRAKCA
ncbi:MULTISPECIES: hypothetical protein [Pseudomonas syringae group genomosp. 2]|uniref:hypothetical protein n=1 Tax=Pseudomonas syringae group genomosp. 2 TaxID=251698 RepID=UPI0006B8F43D|nr:MULTISPECIES: hypothetical protein [Pseudomonas syringae group genomosp. 2]KPB59412.1 Uncharacterized protein AC508_3842 [Pseudomonas amygdali pv. mellea]KPB60425.1 Uncharacterized protein AC512_4787 [Pseudomonas savastanoi pv. phaseolicola]MBN4174360.1 hypothetical protein [Pseudomonas savastanoi pv. phaseolicola]